MSPTSIHHYTDLFFLHRMNICTQMKCIKLHAENKNSLILSFFRGIFDNRKDSIVLFIQNFIFFELHIFLNMEYNNKQVINKYKLTQKDAKKKNHC